MDTDIDTDTDGCKYRWIQIQYGLIQIDKLFNFICNSRFDGWIDCIHDSTIQIDKLFNFICNSRFDGWIDCIHDSTIQIDKLFYFIWNSGFDGWIDYIHDCIHDSTIQMDTDTDTNADGYKYNTDG